MFGATTARPGCSTRSHPQPNRPEPSVPSNSVTGSATPSGSCVWCSATTCSSSSRRTFATTLPARPQGRVVALDDERCPDRHGRRRRGDQRRPATAEGTPVDLRADARPSRHRRRRRHRVARPASLVAAIAAVEPAMSRDEDVLARQARPGRAHGSSRSRCDQRSSASFVVSTSRPAPTVPRSSPLSRCGSARVASCDVVSFGVTDARIAARSRSRRRRWRARRSRRSRSRRTHRSPICGGSAREEIHQVGRRQPMLRDADRSRSSHRGRALATPVIVELDARSDTPRTADSSALRILVGTDFIELDGIADPADPGVTDRIAGQLGTLLNAGLATPDSPALAAADARRRGAGAARRHQRHRVDHDRQATLDSLFHDQVARTPDAPALSSGSVTLTYAELEAAAASLRARLAAAGIGRGDRVGIALPRGVDMVVGVLATLDLGAAYLPLDPTYPTDRLHFMIDDAGIAVLLATDGAAELGRSRRARRGPDDAPFDAAGAGTRVTHDADRSRLRDLHLRVDGYAQGGDARAPAGDQLLRRDGPRDRPRSAGTWLAVTSLSFDISVLELLWTLTRGFHVVLKSDRGVSRRGSIVRKHRAR